MFDSPSCGHQFLPSPTHPRGFHPSYCLCSTPGVCSTVGDVQYTGGYDEYPEGYHDKCEGRSLQKQLNLYRNPSVLNIPRCTHGIPHTHHGIPHCTHGIPLVYGTSPAVLMISPTVLNTPGVLMIFPSCTQ